MSPLRLVDDLLSVLGLASASVVALSMVLRAAPLVVGWQSGGEAATRLVQDGLAWGSIGLMTGASLLLFGAITWLGRRAGRTAMALALLALCWLTVGPDSTFAIGSTAWPTNP